MARLGWVLFFIMFIITSGLVYKFIFSGLTKLADDGRNIILLDNSEQTFFLNEMRGFLVAVEQINKGIETDNMKQISSAARNVGTRDLSKVPTSLMGKMPLAVKKMGLSTHKAFDQLALDAEQLGDKNYTLSQLNQILSTCTACHALYRVH